MAVCAAAVTADTQTEEQAKANTDMRYADARWSGRWMPCVGSYSLSLDRSCAKMLLPERIFAQA